MGGVISFIHRCNTPVPLLGLRYHIDFVIALFEYEMLFLCQYGFSYDDNYHTISSVCLYYHVVMFCLIFVHTSISLLPVNHYSTAFKNIACIYLTPNCCELQLMYNIALNVICILVYQILSK